ncbi:DUF4468 domain-containing protein [Sphingobacterium sp. DN00404]|uniref:DUF4468 domain-containing protein n=1 Tax=Sphingobacterium micropteri TaxID=2763501 RepID=A0ABR7YNT2_9SPHI|nr:DUF4468 domain-containing protein [Sphingobacterium micropteri]MBD1432934.1 DUF4468 domain-containing protein [Sphingobacterium micropteri]
MKLVYPLLLWSLPLWSFSQDAGIFNKVYKPSYHQIDSVASYIPLKDGKVVYREFITYQGDKDKAYIALKRWFVDNFPDIQNVIQIDDRETGTLVGKSVRKYNFKSGVNKSDFSMYFTVSVNINANTVDMSIYNIYGSDKRRNNLQMYLEATNAMLNENINFDQHNSVEMFNVDLTKSYFDYLKGKRRKYNGRVVYTVDSEVRGIFESARKAVASGSETHSSSRRKAPNMGTVFSVL